MMDQRPQQVFSQEERPGCSLEEDLVGNPSDSIPNESALFDFYQRVAENRPGTEDAEIFEKIHEWTFSDFSIPPHEFAGVSKEELLAWQKRNRINLSTGHIRPDPIDVERAYAWGHIRMTATANRLHTNSGPPSVEEVKKSFQV